MIGIKEIPDKITCGLILTFMRTHFKYLTLSEFRLAFELNILDDDKDKPHHYQCFDLNFITPVIKRFLKQKQQALNSLDRISKPKELDQPLPTGKQLYEGLLKYIQEKKQMPLFWNWTAVYMHMEESGMVSESDDELKTFRKKILEKTKAKVSLEIITAFDAIERNKISDKLSKEKMLNAYMEEYVKMKLSKD